MNVDRGGLRYPTEFVSRWWTVYTFIKNILPKIVGNAYVLNDVVNSLSPKLEDCSTFVCEVAEHGEKNTELIKFCIRKFVSPLLINNAAASTESNDTTSLVVTTNSKNRRLRTLK